MAELYLLICLTDALFIAAIALFSAQQLPLGMANFSTLMRLFLQPIVQELLSRIDSAVNSVLAGYQGTLQCRRAGVHNIYKSKNKESVQSHQDV